MAGEGGRRRWGSDGRRRSGRQGKYREIDLFTLEAAQRGDRAAFDAIVDLYDERLRLLAFHLLHDADLADDALQDTFFNAYRGLPAFGRRASLGTWLYRITYTVCMGYLRRRRAPGVSYEEAEEVIGADDDPADGFAARSQLTAALASLSPEQRVVVLLVDRDGFDYQSVADVLDVPKGTVCSRLVTARAALRETLTTRRSCPRRRPGARRRRAEPVVAGHRGGGMNDRPERDPVLEGLMAPLEAPPATERFRERLWERIDAAERLDAAQAGVALDVLEAPPASERFHERLWERIEAAEATDGASDGSAVRRRRPSHARPRGAGRSGGRGSPPWLSPGRPWPRSVAVTLIGWPLGREQGGLGGPPPAVAQVIENVRLRLGSSESIGAVFTYERAGARRSGRACSRPATAECGRLRSRTRTARGASRPPAPNWPTRRDSTLR